MAIQIQEVIKVRLFFPFFKTQKSSPAPPSSSLWAWGRKQKQALNNNTCKRCVGQKRITGIFDMPPEIRNTIWSMALTKAPDPEEPQFFEEEQDRATRSDLYQPALLATNKQIRAEALPIYYGNNSFYVSMHIEHGLPMRFRTKPNGNTQVLDLGSDRARQTAANNDNDIKANLDRLLRHFIRSNGVDDHLGSRLALIRDLKMKVTYQYYSDGFDIEGIWTGEISGYTYKQRSTSDGDLDDDDDMHGELEVDRSVAVDDPTAFHEVQEEDHEVKGKTVKVWRRKKEHRLIRRAHRARHMLGARGQWFGRGWDLYKRGPEGTNPPDCYGYDALLWFAKFCPLATKEVGEEIYVDAV